MDNWSGAWSWVTLLVACVWAVSAKAKFRDVDATQEALTSLGLPNALRQHAVALAVPIVEAVLALALVVLPSPATMLAAALSVLLMVAYLALVSRVVLRGEAAQCACFGTVFGGLVTWRTVVRNVLLLAATSLILAGAIAGESFPHVIGQHSASDTWWALAALLSIAVVALVVYTPAAGAPMTDEDGDYIRRPIPEALLVSPVGDVVRLQDLAAEQARLLLFLSPGCMPCRAVAEAVPHWTQLLHPAVAIHPVVQQFEQLMSDFSNVREGAFVTDEFDSAPKALGIVSTPAAVLLGSDGLLAGGPVSGVEDIRAMVEDIVHELQPSA